MICDVCKCQHYELYGLNGKELCTDCWREYAPVIIGAPIYVDLVYDSIEPTDSPLEI